MSIKKKLRNWFQVLLLLISSKVPYDWRKRFLSEKVMIRAIADSNEEKTLNVLTAALELIAKGWCQKNFATNSKGKWVEVESKEAVNFCISGAIHRARYNMGGDIDDKAYEYLRQALKNYCCPVGFNPVVRWQEEKDRKKSEIIKLINNAILLCMYK